MQQCKAQGSRFTEKWSLINKMSWLSYYHKPTKTVAKWELLLRTGRTGGRGVMLNQPDLYLCLQLVVQYISVYNWSELHEQLSSSTLLQESTVSGGWRKQEVWTRKAESMEMRGWYLCLWRLLQLGHMEDGRFSGCVFFFYTFKYYSTLCRWICIHLHSVLYLFIRQLRCQSFTFTHSESPRTLFWRLLNWRESQK